MVVVGLGAAEIVLVDSLYERRTQPTEYDDRERIAALLFVSYVALIYDVHGD